MGEADALVGRSIDASINFFDTADSYSTGDSEEAGDHADSYCASGTLEIAGYCTTSFSTLPFFDQTPESFDAKRLQRCVFVDSNAAKLTPELRLHVDEDSLLALTGLSPQAWLRPRSREQTFRFRLLSRTVHSSCQINLWLLRHGESTRRAP